MAETFEFPFDGERAVTVPVLIGRIHLCDGSTAQVLFTPRGVELLIARATPKDGETSAVHVHDVGPRIGELPNWE